MTTTDGKRRWHDDGRAGPSKKAAPSPAARSSTYGPMFAAFRDHMDAHHDRRERVVKASRDITALSKKIIFALQRVRRIQPVLPADVDRDVQARLADVSRLLAAVAPELQGLNRGRYGRVLYGMEELMEALTFWHYLRHQALLAPEAAAEQVAQLCRTGAAAAAAAAAAAKPVDGAATKNEAEDTADTATTTTPAPPPALVVTPDDNEYLMGVFDLSGEMMRFATTSAALRGELASDGETGGSNGGGSSRTIVSDMQALASFFQMLPQRYDKSWKTKMQVMHTSVQKVERLGYDLRVRGSERPKGWVPDADNEPPPPADE